MHFSRFLTTLSVAACATAQVVAALELRQVTEMFTQFTTEVGESQNRISVITRDGLLTDLVETLACPAAPNVIVDEITLMKRYFQVTSLILGPDGSNGVFRDSEEVDGPKEGTQVLNQAKQVIDAVYNWCQVIIAKRPDVPQDQLPAIADSLALIGPEAQSGEPFHGVVNRIGYHLSFDQSDGDLEPYSAKVTSFSTGCLQEAFLAYSEAPPAPPRLRRRNVAGRRRV